MNRRALLVLRALDLGGAERQAVLLGRELVALGWEVGCACFYPGGALEPAAIEAGIIPFDLGKRGRWDLVGTARRLRSVVRAFGATHLYGFLPDTSLLALAGRGMSDRPSVVWGVRSSEFPDHRYGPAVWTRRQICRVGSRWADAIIANSRAGARDHIALGYPRDRMHVVENGVDLDCFVMRPREPIRDAVHIGIVGRFDPIKRHELAIDALGIARRGGFNGRLVIVGDGPPERRALLHQRAIAAGIADHLSWLGFRDDVQHVYPEFDWLCMTSESEGFPNVIVEAMACGVPSLAAPAGDSAAIVAGTGRVVDGDASVWAAAFSTLSPPSDAMRLECRRVAAARFGSRRMAEATAAVLAHARQLVS